MDMEAPAPNRPEEREDPETVRVIEQRLRTAEREPKRGDEALEEIRQKRRKQPAPR
jgi:hypothetical protein